MITSSQNEKRRWTEEELAALPDDGYNHEVVRERLVLSPKNNPEHGEIAAELSSALRSFAKARQLGTVWDSSTGFWMDNENCRAPDISFVRKERLRGLTRPPKRFFRGAPDLAVEILAPSNTEQDLKERLADYFSSGTQIAWVIDPESKTATVYHGPEIRSALAESDFLDGEHLLPGFRFAIAQLFADWNWE